MESDFLLLLMASEFVDGDAAEQLGVEIGGLLGHDAAGKGDAGHVVDGRGIEQEARLGRRKR